MSYLVNSNQQRSKFNRTVLPFTIFTTTSTIAVSGGYTAGYVDVYKNRERLHAVDDYTASDGSSISFVNALVPGDILDIVVYTAVQTDNVVRKSGDALTGTLVVQDVVPASDNTYNLGNTTTRFADLYLSGNTIYLGGVTLSANDTNLVVSNTTGGAVTLTGNVILGTGTTGDYVATVDAGDGLAGSANGEGSAPTISVVANNGISANADGVFAVSANGISVTSDGINVVGIRGIASNTTGTYAVGANGIVVTADGINAKANSGISVDANGITAVGANGISVTSDGINVVANNGIISNTSGVFVKTSTGISVDGNGIKIGQEVATTSNVVFERVTSNTASITTANVTTVNATTVGTTTLNAVNINATGNLSVTGTKVNLTTVEANNVTVTANLVSNIGTFADVTITGNLTVSGTTTYVQTSDLSVGDNKIVLNSDLTNGTAPSENISVIANRGSSSNVAITWNETTDKWTFSNDGGTYLNIASNNDVTAAYTNATSYADTRDATAYSNATSYADTKAGQAYTNATSYADTASATAYTNAVSTAATDASTKAATAYSNATSYADTKAATAYSNATTFAANADNISSGTVANARLTAANTTTAGIVRLVDSVTNTSIAIAATANSVKTALDLAVANAATAYTNAASYADTKAGDAYSNAVSYADTKAGQAYTNAASYADTVAATSYSNAVSYADTKSATAYSNAVSAAATDASTKAATAYSNATSYADTKAATAYSNAIAYSANASNITSGTVANARLNAANTTQSGIVQLVDSVNNTSITVAATANSVKQAYDLAVTANTAAGQAYANAASYADTKADQAYTNAASYADTVAATAYTNATSYADTAAATAYTNAASYADTKAGQAFTNATAFAANATNITSGTLDTARLPTTANVSTAINVGANINISTSTVNIGNSTVNTTITSSVVTTSNVVATNLSGNGASITSVNAATVGGNTAATLRSYSDTVAATAYSNAVSYADTKAGAAYTNAVSYADTKAAAAYTNATSYADTKAGQAYSNGVSYTDGVATTTYNNATGYADTKAGQAYTNAVSYTDTAVSIKANTANPTFTGNVTANVINVNQYIDFSNTGSAPSKKEGRLFYDVASKTMAYHVEEPDITMNIGQELWTRVYNNTGSTITDGSPVYITGSTGGVPTIGLADATDADKMDVIGLATHSIEDGTYGYVTAYGRITPIDTTGMSIGDKVYVSPSTPGGITTVAPTYPNWAFHLGEVMVVGNSSVGSILVDLEPHHMPTLRVEGDARIDGDVTIAGNLTLLGNTTTTSVTNLSVGNTFIYMSGGDASSNNNFTGSGLNDVDWDGHLQYSNTTTFYVKIVSAGGTDTFAWSKDNFSTVEANNVSITGDYQYLGGGMRIKFNATTGHTLNDVWSATLTPINLDSGIISNYHTGENGTYSHVGYFRDATDNKFKFFKQYTPEPNTSIDTSHASFQLGDIVANTFTGDLVGSVTGNADTATALATARKIQLTGDVTGNVNFDGSTNVQIAATIGTLNTALTIANTLTTGNTTVNGMMTVTGNANFHGNTLFIDTVNDRVGIKTAAPSAPLTVGEGGATLTTPLIQATDTQNSYIQVALQNLSNGEYASGDFVITADNGTDLTNYVDLGLGSSQYNYPDFGVVQPLDGYLYTHGGRTLIGTGTNKDIVFFTGNTTAGSEKIYFHANGDAKFLGKVVVNNSVTATLLIANVDASNIVSGTIANARLNAANTTQAGIVQLVDTTTNTSVTIAGTANSVKTAYDTAISANTRAASAQTEASAAYSNAVSVAATDATNKAANAYSNALSSAASLYLPLAGGTLTGNVLVSNSNLSVNGAIKFANSTGGSFAYTQYNAATASIDTIFG